MYILFYPNALNIFQFLIFSNMKFGFFFILNLLVLFISVSIHVYLTLSHQEDLETSYALCKVFGLTSFPILLICMMIANMGLMKGDMGTFLPIAQLLFHIVRTLVAIGIIVTNDNLRSYSGEKIALIINTIFHFLKVGFKRIFLCRCSQNQIHEIVE